MSRELSDEAALHQAKAFKEYEARGGPLSLSKWLDTKDFSPADRMAIISRLVDVEPDTWIQERA